MQFHLLGPVEIHSGGQALEIGSPQQRLVAAALAVDAGRLVTAEALIDRVWDAAPSGARRTLHVLITRTRRALEQAPDGEGVTVVGRSGGYVLTIDPSHVDIHRFRQLVDTARRSGDEAATASLRDALQLWRGEPLTGLRGDWASGTRAAWRQEYLDAVLAWARAELAAGDPAVTVGPLTALAGEHPLAESVGTALMKALAAAGRPADALGHYTGLRQRLADELGVDPGTGTQAVYQAILHGQAATGGATVPAQPPPGGPVVPRQLPAALGHLFTGRAAEMTRLTTVLGSGESGRPVVIAGIGGAAGVGKTWLALHWAHEHADRFPDGQLWLNLRGFDPSEPPLDTGTAVQGLLEGLGVVPAAVPVSPQAQAGLYRSLAAGKRILLVLDNARDVSQVEPLLPGSPTCAVLITSRHRMAGLAATHGALTLDLDTFSDGDAYSLMARHLGAGRLASEPGAARDLLAGCAGLPLAISIVAARAAAQPRFPLAAMAAELGDDLTRLDALDTGDRAASVRSVLSWSYRALDPAARDVFSLLGLAPGPDISVQAAASLCASTVPQTQPALRALETMHLVQQHVQGRYRMHDLVHLYALELAESQQRAGARTAALWRVTGYYLHTAAAGELTLSPQRGQIDLVDPGSGCTPDFLAGKEAALAWFGREYPCLLATQRLAAAQGWHEHVWQLAWATDSYHKFRGSLGNWVMTWQAALSAADQLGKPAVQALTRRCLGYACSRTGQHARARTYLEEALSFAGQAGDAAARAHTHNMFTRVLIMQGSHERALEHAQTALRLFRELGLGVWEADTLMLLSDGQGQLGDLDQARSAGLAALELHRQYGDQHGAANSCDCLGYVALEAGEYAQALRHHGEALALWRGLGHSHGEADSLAGQAVAYTALGDRDNATRASRQALALLTDQHRLADVEQLRLRLERFRARSAE